MADRAQDTLGLDYDVLVIGAGVSGIDVAYRLQEWLPQKRFAVLESRSDLGGTWDLFKYPGVRSDSDLHTFGFAFRPWQELNAIAEGPVIKQYLVDTVTESGIDKKILYNHKVISAEWASDDGTWTLTVQTPRGNKKFVSSFVVFCTGYYDYSQPLEASIPGIRDFKGQTIHPQSWPTDLDCQDKNIVVIGSGATAITLLPNLAKKAAHVVQLQRSPSYVFPVPQDDSFNKACRVYLSRDWAAKFIRIKEFIIPWLFYVVARSFPQRTRKFLKNKAKELLPPGYAMEPNFEPNYDPWDQRLCFSPKGDYFEALHTDNAEILTAHIDKVTSDSIILKDSNRILKPDIIVTATGLKILLVGGVNINIDGETYKPSTKYMYRGSMMQDLPNAAVAIGYANASWTLGSDVGAHFICRLLKSMQRNKQSVAIPRMDPRLAARMTDKPVLGLTSTYVTKAKTVLPKAASHWPWQPKTMYLKDLFDAKFWPFKSIEFR